jgi:hypothetical protein
MLLYDRLEPWEDDELLSFESCEARVPGRFDPMPEDSPDWIDDGR